MDYNNQLFMEAIFEFATPSHIVYAMYHKDDDISEDVVIKKNYAGKHKKHDRANMLKDKAKHGQRTPRKWDTNKAYNQQNLIAARKRAMRYDDVFDDITMEEAAELAAIEAVEREYHIVEDRLYDEFDKYNRLVDSLEFIKKSIESLKEAMEHDNARLKELDGIINSIKG